MLNLGGDCEVVVDRMAVLTSRLYRQLRDELAGGVPSPPMPSDDALLGTAERLVAVLVTDRIGSPNPAARPAPAPPAVTQPAAAPAKSNGAAKAGGRLRDVKAFCDCPCECWKQYGPGYQGCSCSCVNDFQNPCGCQNPGPLNGGPMNVEKVEGHWRWKERAA